MEHRSPDPSCPLCGVWGEPWAPDDSRTWGRQHVDADLLWQAWGAPDGIANVVRVARTQLGIDVTRAQARRHFIHHRIEQPMATTPLRGAASIAHMERLTPRLRDIVDLIHRARVLDTRQIAQLCYQRDGLAVARSRGRAREELTALARAHVLYRYLPRQAVAVPHRNEAVWCCGVNARGWLERRWGRALPHDHIVRRSRDVREGLLAHDLSCNEVMVRLQDAVRADGHVDVPGKSIHLREHTDNWFGPRQLALSFHDRRNGRERTMIPDGLMTLCADGPDPDDRGLMPFFVEYDRGTRPAGEVTEQLLAYHWLALEGAAARRLPDLAVEGYRIPTLMVVQDHGRRRRLQARVGERAHEAGITRGAPIVLVVEADLWAAPLTAPVYSVWASEDHPSAPFTQVLYAYSAALLRARRLGPHRRLRIDHEAARPAPHGFVQAPRHLVDA